MTGETEATMVKALIIGLYLTVIVVLGLFARRRSRAGHEDFFLAGRSLGPLLLFLTMAATNFSAFTVFGFAGAGYRIGYAYYPIMAFGTGFMALSFLFIGIPAWRAAKRTGAITPPELIAGRFQNRWLHGAYLGVMVVFTLPYLAIQPMGAGYALQGLLGIPYVWGAVLVVVIGSGYLLLAGMRGDAWTDALQGVLMLAGLAAIVVGLAVVLGGFRQANQQAFAVMPELFQRPGGGATFTPGIWLSYMLLWLLCDPVFPQLFQRFLAAKDERALKTSAVLYPLITGMLFFLPVAVGVMARPVLPDLAGKATDQVLPLVVAKVLPGWMGALAIGCGLAALMSTMDSQLLTLSSMVVRDTRRLAGRAAEATFPWDRLAVVLLALAGLVLALKPPATILEIATETFTGLAVLFPVTLAAALWPRANPWAGFASIISGEALVVLYHFKLLPAFGLLPVIPIVLVSTLVLVAGSLLRPAQGLEAWARLRAGHWRWIGLFALLFLASIDFWNWGKSDIRWLGLPGWLWFHFGLVAVLFLAMLWCVKERGQAQA
ncbi:MAG: sodium:solute symporter family protein [candidate division WOR-3 bacterium]